jgi:hypothetical protein
MEDERHNRLTDALVEIYGEHVEGLGMSVNRHAAIVGLASLLIQLIAGDPNRERIADDVRQQSKLGVRRLAARMVARSQQGGSA